MKNAINYFYNINPINIENINNNYYFKYNNYNYVLMLFNNNKNINDIYNLNQQMIYQKIPVHQIILNKNKLPISIIENKNYILLKIIIKNKDKKIVLNDINKLNNIYINNNNNINIKWSNNWIERIDYLEYQINQIGKKFPNLVESFSYFVGLSENAIKYALNIENNNTNNYSYSHLKITPNTTLFDLYNPINIIVDYKTRDIAEYIKVSFFNNNYNIFEELNNYFKTNYINLNDITLLYARVLYPSFYFHIYDDIITKKTDQKEITKITKRINDYEHYLYEIYLYLKKIYPLPEVEWIKKTNSN